MNDPEAEEWSAESSIGRRIRELRHARGMTLNDLSDRVGLTKGQVSRIENGKVSSPVGTLVQIAKGLGVTLGDLFAPDPALPRAVFTRADDRRLVSGRATQIGHLYESLVPEAPFSKKMEPFMMIIENPELDPAQNVFRHDGHEFLFIVSGRMTYRHGTEQYEMKEGDSLFFDATVEHGPVQVEAPVRFLCIISQG
jgi:transcriptional regulator with XRE-family HTH domain